jgi:glutamate formiminotransferase
MQIVECVPNFSEGQNPETVDAIVQAIQSAGDLGRIAILHTTSDADHHRSVVTFAGEPEVVLEAAIRAVGVAAQQIDLTKHTGVHPRLGAADVVPFVPVENVTIEDCVALAHRAGHAIWERFKVPAYFYERAALRPEFQRLENVRKGGFENRDVQKMPPDVGTALHPTAGASIVGARPFLVAVNVNLASTDVSIAQEIAKSIRASSGGLPCVKALGLALVSRNQVQVSMNLTDVSVTPLHQVFEVIRQQADAKQIAIVGTELIGLIPKRVIEDAARYWLKFEEFSPDRVIETAIWHRLR